MRYALGRIKFIRVTLELESIKNRSFLLSLSPAVTYRQQLKCLSDFYEIREKNFSQNLRNKASFLRISVQ